MRTYAETDRDAARERMSTLWNQSQKVAARYAQAEAVYAGMLLLDEHAGIYPGITHYYYEVESEYDDEGHYFDVALIRFEYDDTPDQSAAVAEHGHPEDWDELGEWSKQACEQLFGVHQNERLPISGIKLRIEQMRRELSEPI